MFEFWLGFNIDYPIVYEKCKKSLNRYDIKTNKILLYVEDSTTNNFSRTRFLTPLLDSSANKWVAFCDDDFLFLKNPKKLMSNLSDDKIVYLCKHDYVSNTDIKMNNKINNNYHCKNWSSLMIFNKDKFNLSMHQILNMNLMDLHQFKWINNDDIGSIPLTWNWLVGEYEYNSDSSALHYTLGGPWYENYIKTDYDKIWLDF
jgi:hypothetical protein